MKGPAHFVTVGATQIMVNNLWNRIAAESGYRFSHIIHPAVDRLSWVANNGSTNAYFFSEDGRSPMPEADRQLLSSLESEDVPSIHNMICGDQIVSKLKYDEALQYATFVTRRLMSLFGELRPTAIIGAFDLLHASLALAVAKKAGIPWFALNFSVIPPGYACFCNRMSATSRVMLNEPPAFDVQALAETSLEQFEKRSIVAPAYIAPRPRSLAGKIVKLPLRVRAAYQTAKRARRRQYLKFVEPPGGHDVGVALRQFQRTASARSALASIRTMSDPPRARYALFGLHVQPESSIDVWAPFFSNQLWVIELLARSIPPTHKLLVKIHKSDVSNYSRAQLLRMKRFPGVDLVEPFSDTRRFIENADLIFSIQGTMGLEAALLGIPVIMLGDSPVDKFPSASRIGKITDLPSLVRDKLEEQRPQRSEIVKAYAEFLSPFVPAAHNDWTKRPGDSEIAGFAELFVKLERSLQGP